MRDDCYESLKIGEGACSVEQLFGESWREDLANLLAKCGEESYECESQVIKASAPPDKVFLLKKGRVEMIASNGRTKRIEECTPGPPKVFGIVDVLSGTTSIEDIRAATPCVFDVIEADDLRRFLGERPDLCFRLTQALSSLCRSSVKRLADV